MLEIQKEVFMKLIIDRLENEWCVCEYEAGKTLDLPRGLLPPDAKEGNVLTIAIDQKETNNRKDYAEQLRKKLFER